MHSWFIKSFNKSAHVYEWFVVPFIVVASLTTGMLQSVGLGIAMSTLIFVESFHKAGVVKFLANGLTGEFWPSGNSVTVFVEFSLILFYFGTLITVRSTIERNCEDNEWLNQNADLIQILVLQNYMFFGNATSCLKYISTMFDDEDISGFDGDLPPIPKYIIIDMSIVTGIDTSAGMWSQWLSKILCTFSFVFANCVCSLYFPFFPFSGCVG